MLCSEAFQACRTQDDALQCLASRDKAPERDQQLACQSDDHRLAGARTAIGSAGPVPLCQCALLLKQQKAPGELDHAAADPGIAGSGEALFPSLRAALVRRARQAGVTRHRSSVTNWPREHLMDEHISRFNADADDPSHASNHGVRPGLRLLFHRFSRASSISLIWLTTKPSRALSRCNSPETFGGSGMPSGVRTVARRSAALRRVGLKLRMPSRARVALMRFTMRVRSPTRHSRSRLGRLASSSAIVGTRAMLQWPRSPDRKS